MSYILKTIKVRGKNLDLNGESGLQIKVSLNQKLVLYKDAIQVVGDEKIVIPDADGYWEIDLLDTDNMSENPFYIFDIGGMKYRRYLPVSVSDYEFADLPAFTL